MLQSLEAQTEQAERNLDFDEGGQRLAQVRSHEGGAGHAGHVVNAAGKFQNVFTTVVPGVSLHLLEGLDRADDGSMLVVHRHGVQADRNFVSGFVVQKADGLGGAGRLDGAGDRAIFVAEFTTGLIAVQQSFCDTGVANDFVAQVTGDALGAVAPEHNLFLHVDDAQAGGQAFEDAAADFRVVKCGHGWSREDPCLVGSSAKIHRDFRSWPAAPGGVGRAKGR